MAMTKNNKQGKTVQHLSKINVDVKTVKRKNVELIIVEQSLW